LRAAGRAARVRRGEVGTSEWRAGAHWRPRTLAARSARTRVRFTTARRRAVRWARCVAREWNVGAGRVALARTGDRWAIGAPLTRYGVLCEERAGRARRRLRLHRLARRYLGVRWRIVAEDVGDRSRTARRVR